MSQTCIIGYKNFSNFKLKSKDSYFKPSGSGKEHLGVLSKYTMN